MSLHVSFNYAFGTQVTLNIFTLDVGVANFATVNSSDVLLKTMLNIFFSTEVTNYFVLSFACVSSMHAHL